MAIVMRALRRSSGQSFHFYAMPGCASRPRLLSGDPRLADSRSSNLAPQHSVQIECRADQCEMCKGLREIAQCLALRSCLF